MSIFSKWKIRRQLKDIRVPEKSEMVWKETDATTLDGRVVRQLQIRNGIYLGIVSVEQGKTPDAWTVEWYLLNRPVEPILAYTLVSESKKEFTTKENAERYAAAKCKWLTEIFFSDWNPVIPKDFIPYFTVKGQKVPAYNYAS